MIRYIISAYSTFCDLKEVAKVMTSRKITKYMVINVNCNISTAPPEVRVRLVEGKTPSEGRVMLTVGDVTGTVCDDYFTDIEAGVVCRMMGYRYKRSTADTVYNQSCIG